MLKMITSYFTNRTQQVEVNGHVSELRKASLGVPQGSILGSGVGAVGAVGARAHPTF